MSNGIYSATAVGQNNDRPGGQVTTAGIRRGENGPPTLTQRRDGGDPTGTQFLRTNGMV